MTRLEHMQTLPKCDLLIVDEIDETVLYSPYAFAAGSTLQLNGIWNWKDNKVIGLSATTWGNIDQIIEDVVIAPDQVSLLQFKSEYEFVTQKSTLNGNLVTLAAGENILAKIIEQCTINYQCRPVICFLE